MQRMNLLNSSQLNKILAFCFCLLYVVSIQSNAQTKRPLPNAKQIAWQKAELGVIFHYDLHVFDTSLYVQAKNRITPIADYNIFNPTQLNVEQWVIAAKQAGARFALITATHETGFALYPSDVNPYSVKALKWKDGKADIVKDFVEACRKHGLEPGIYMGIRWNSFLGVHDFKVEGTGEMQKARQAYYNKVVEGMVTEICTRYGPLFEIWFDGGASSPDKGAPNVLPIVQKFQPNCLFYHNDQLAEARWGGSESGTVSYPCWSTFPYDHTGSGESTNPSISKNNYALLKEGDMNGTFWMPAMADAPLRGYKGRHEWFWEPGDEQHIFPLQHLIQLYYQSVGRNATLILGLTPDNRGLLPDADVARLQAWGEELKRRFDHPIDTRSGKGNIIEIPFLKSTMINQVLIQENISKGHRVKRFTIEALVDRKWITISEGSAIGQKYIKWLDTPIITKKIRLCIQDAFAEPDIEQFAVYTIE